MYTPSSTAFLRPTRGGRFKFVEYDDNAFPYPQTIGNTANSISGLGPADESMIDTIFIMPNKGTDSTATMMIVVDEVDPSTDPKTYQYVYVGNINDLPSDVLTESSIVNDLSTGGIDKPLSAEQGRTLNSHVNYTICGSNAGDQVKLISDDGFELSTHLRLLVRMNNTNTHATPRFNINNTGIKDVWYNGSVASDINTWAAGEVLDVYYDGTKYITNTHGGAQFSTGEKVGDVGIDDEPTAGSDNLVKGDGIYKSIDSAVNDYIQIIDLSYNQTAQNSGYKECFLQANTTYRITVIVNWTDTHYLRNINFYSQQSGSAIVARLADIFGVEVFLDGFNRTVEYTPQSNIRYLASTTDSGYTETEGCTVEIVIDEKGERFLDLGNTQTLTNTQKENIKTKIGTDTTVTENSNNLITGGAVFNAIKPISDEMSELNDEIEGANIPAETIWSSPGYTSAAFKYVSNPCIEGASCTAKLVSVGSWCRLGFSKTDSASWESSDMIVIDATKASKNTQFTAPSQVIFPYILYFLGSSSCSIQIEKNAVTEKGLKDKVDDLIDDVGNLSNLETTDKTSIVAAINETLSKGSSVAPVNIFGDILPASFKAKMYANDDILVVCQGDSIMGLIENCNANTDAAHDCPGGQYTHFVMQTQKTVCKVKPFYNRLDSQRNNADFFTKTGTWEQATNTTFSPEGDPAILDNMAEHSVACLTYRSNSNNAAVSFVFDADTYDKCNIIFSKNIYAAPAIIEITEGDGKMLVSEDRINWVEANGFTHSQATAYYYPLGRGDAFCERHRRLWMKKVSGVTGTINITYRRNDSDTTYFYCWGTEMYKGRGIFFDNIGRGGRNIGLLGYNISDIFDRNPDLAIVECPLANDLSNASNTTYEILIGKYQNYFMDNGTNDTFSYRKRSNDYANFPLMVVLPHIRSVAFDGDAAVLEGSTYQKITTEPAYDIYKRVLGWLHTNLDSYQNVCLVDVLDQYLAQAKVDFGTIQAGLTGGKLTSDGIHLNQKGSNLYVDYLAPIFQI